MRRTDISLIEIERQADHFFNRVGRGRGTGHKQYQRWLYERKFHVDAAGYLIPATYEARQYELFLKGAKTGSRTTTPWTEVGPTTIDPTTGWNPGIGRLTSVAIHPSNESVIYVGSPGGGIWKSTNAGATWSPLLDATNAGWMHVFHIAIDPSNTSTLYAAIEGGGVIKSTNAGSSWSASGSGPSDSRKVLVHPTNSSIVYATAANGIWRSANGGATWTQVIIGDAEDLEFKPGNPNVVIGSGYWANIVRSTDNGLTWSILGAPEGITHNGRTLLGVSPDDPDVVYAVQSNSNLTTFGRIYKSTNAGQTFTTTVIGDPATGTNYFGYSNQGTDNLGQAWYDMAVCVNPANADEVHIAGIICWKSVDGGYSFFSETGWQYGNSYGYNHADVHALEWINTTIYAGTDGGIFKSTNQGGDWTDLSEGLGIRQIYRFSSFPAAPGRMVIGAQDNGTSFRHAAGNWKDWLGGDGMDNLASPTDSNLAYGSAQYGELFRTINGGSTYVDINEPSSEGAWVTPLAMHPSNHNIIYGGYTGVYRSDNGGSTWALISGSSINDEMDVLEVAPSNPNYIYGTVGSILYRTSNGGTTWTSVQLSAPVSSIFISGSNPEKIWVTLVATSNQVGLSVNMGTTFTWISAGLPNIAARSVAVDEAADNGIYVGMNVGVYYRDDVNQTWTVLGTGLPLVAIRQVELVPSAGIIRVATYGRGVWENELTGGSSFCGLNFYDTGGPGGNYSNNESWTLSLCPDDPEDKLQLAFTAFALEEDYDFLEVFNGNSVNNPPMHPGNGFTGNTSPGILTSTHSSGCLTARFTSDFSITDIGWTAAISCIPLSCVSEVSNVNDSGPGSLREIIASGTCTDTVTFNPAVNSQFIDLTSGSIDIHRHVVLMPSASQQIKIRSAGSYSVFTIDPGKNVHFENIQLFGGSNYTGQAIYNQGQLTLKNVSIFRNENYTGLAVFNAGLITVKGVVEVNY